MIAIHIDAILRKGESRLILYAKSVTYSMRMELMFFLDAKE
jgi:hypothetical protein